MGRSVMTLNGAEAIAYLTFEPDESYYRELFDDDVADGLVEPEDDFEAYMYRRFEADSEYEWGGLVEYAALEVKRLFPSFELADVIQQGFPEWVGRELRVIARNAHSIVTISEYSGIVALCLGANYDRSEFWADPSELAGIGKHWRQQVAARFESIGTLSKTGTFSNGTSAYSEAGA